jgi:hypothetical protein
MGIIVEALQEFNVSEDSFVHLDYGDTADVWHITDDYISTALIETTTASMLAALLAAKTLTVYSRWDENILEEMRGNGLLEDYDHEDWFEDYLTETIQQGAYEYDLLSVTTEKYDYKRGACAVQSSVKVLVSEVLELGDTADDLFAGWNVSVRTKSGILTLEQ